ncbi:UPF0175 family protein [Desulfococcaceae bacterium HSG9]|nr:UPF0175 family protein [Desulfococcaceae bacterium HSG9]
MLTIAIDIPDDIAENFDTLEDLRLTLYEDFIIEQRQNGKINFGKAAELIEISYTEIFDLLGGQGLSFINSTPQELEQSYHHFNYVMGHAR